MRLALKPSMARVYKNLNAHEFISLYVESCNQEDFLREFKRDVKLQQKFLDYLVNNENANVADAWNNLLYDFAESVYVDSVETERALRKKCNIHAPEDDEEIDLVYAVVR